MDEKKQETQVEEIKLTPQQYFDEIKERKHHCTDELLNRIFSWEKP